MSRRPSGFTLLELVVATAMVAIMALSLYAAMGVGFRARQSVREQTQAARQAAIVLDLVERELQSVMPPTGVLAGPMIAYANGTTGSEADTIEFYAVGADADTGDDPLGEGIRRVQIVPSGDTLVMRVERNLLSSVQTPVEDQLLARGVRAFGLRYYNGYGWQPEWDSTQLGNILPVAVEITIELNDPVDTTRTYRSARLVPISTGRITTNASLFGLMP